MVCDRATLTCTPWYIPSLELYLLPAAKQTEGHVETLKE